MPRMVFLRTAWMERYNGTDGDQPKWGGSYIAEHGEGGEVYNFRPYRGRCFGSAQVSPIDLERIDERARGDSLHDVLVIWVARHRWRSGVRITGWYRNATLFSGWQPRPMGALPRGERRVNYIAGANAKDCRLLLPAERDFPIPRASKGTPGFGQSLMWYADAPELARFRREVLAYVNRVESATRRKTSGGKSTGSSKNRGGWKPIPPERRHAIEDAAMNHAGRWLEQQGFHTRDVSAENLGWDITATQDRSTLRVEVKGLSGGQGCVELTPNEYAAMKRHRREHCICVVLNALDKSKRTLKCVGWNPEKKSWTDDASIAVKLAEMTGCRITLQ